MKVCHLTTHTSGGGAAIAAMRLHRSLMARGVDSVVVGRYSEGIDQRILSHLPSKSIAGRVGRHLRAMILKAELQKAGANQERNYSLFSSDKGDVLDAPSKLQNYDIIHLHWISGIPQFQVMPLVDMGSFFRRFGRGQKFVWTLHDLNPVTGGCHHPGNCKRFEMSCGNCPQLMRPAVNDLSRQVWTRKNASYGPHLDGIDLTYVANSQWTASMASMSSIAGGRVVEVIHPGIETSVFQPLDKPECRRILGIPAKSMVVAFGAAAVDSKVKGVSTLLQALERLSATVPVHLLTFGGGEAPGFPAERLTHVGSISNDRFMAVVYNAADVFVIPSFAESFGQTAAEAQACGIPVVGSKVGGIPEIVEDGVTGNLVAPGDSEALCVSIERLLTDLEYRAVLCRHARSRAVDHFEADVQAEKYRILYEWLLNKPKA